MRFYQIEMAENVNATGRSGKDGSVSSEEGSQHCRVADETKDWTNFDAIDQHRFGSREAKSSSEIDNINMIWPASAGFFIGAEHTMIHAISSEVKISKQGVLARKEVFTIGCLYGFEGESP